jgi:cytidylate kinase
MSIVTISETVGSLGTDIGHRVAEALGYEFADREIISKAAERFGEGIAPLTHAAEEKPTLWERFSETQRRYVAYLEATMFEMAARDNVVLVGHAATIVLGKAPHTLRVRITAPEKVRAHRVERQRGGSGDAALSHVRHIDRERAARVKFLYHVDLDDSLLYDLVLNTEELSAVESARLIRETLQAERFRATAASRMAMTNLSLVAQAKAALLADPVTRSRPISVACADAAISLGGSVDAEQVRTAAEAAVARIPGVARVVNEILVGGYAGGDDELSHGQFRHGEERSWGGYGGGWYDRERRARVEHEDHAAGGESGRS